tara:strand:+ start:691 stop:885 length:195 start_codon:yes stop_codon:yes gene_type:complete
MKSDIKRQQELQKEQYQQLLADAQSQREANNQNNEPELRDIKMESTNISIDTTKGGEVSGMVYK